MARLKKAKIRQSKAGRAFRQWDTDYLSSRKAKRTFKTPSKAVKRFSR